MGPNYDLELIATILQRGFRETVGKVVASQLLTIPGRLVFEYMESWYYENGPKHGSTPTRADIKDIFPQIPIPENPQHSLEALIDIIQTKHLGTQLAAVLPKIQEINNMGDSRQAYARLETLIRNVSHLDGMEVVDVGAAAFDALQGMMERIRTKQGLLGYPWPWESLNAPTQGIKPRDFLLAYSTPHVGKTSLGCFLASHMYMRYNARVAVICGLEMTRDDMLEIIGCNLAGVSRRKLRKDDLSEEERARLTTRLAALKEEAMFPDARSKLFIFETQELGLKPLQRILDNYGPDFCFYDALYSADKGNFNNQLELVKGALTATRKSSSAVFVTWNANIRMSATSSASDQSDFGGTSAIIQKPDLSMKLRRKHRANTMEIGFPKTRLEEMNPIYIKYTPGEFMTEIPKSQVPEDEAPETPGTGTDESGEFWSHT